MDIVSRVKGILLSPKTEWPVIAAEPATVNSLYTGYAMILAAIPAICGFIGGSMIGASYGGITFRTPIVSGLILAVLGYVVGLVMLFVQAKIIEAVAPKFGGQASTVSGLKLVVYASTASWLLGVFTILPLLGFVTLLGALYGLYLLYLGVRPITNCPEDKSLVLTLVIVGLSILAFIVAAVIITVFTGIILS